MKILQIKFFFHKEFFQQPQKYQIIFQMELEKVDSLSLLFQLKIKKLKN